MNDGSSADRYCTTPHPDQGRDGGEGAGRASLAPIIHEVTDMPYEVEEPDNSRRDEPVRVVRRIGQ